MGDLLELAGVIAVATGVPVAMYAVFGLVQRFVVPRRGSSGDLGAAERSELHELRQRVARLEQAVDVVAVEIERVGEAQRYTDRLLAARAAGVPVSPPGGPPGGPPR